MISPWLEKHSTNADQLRSTVAELEVQVEHYKALARKRSDTIVRLLQESRDIDLT